jgi:non-ribosomal peptide synthetase component F
MQTLNNLHGFSNLPSEDQTLLSYFGHGPAISVPHPSIHEAFERIAELYPTITAAKFGEQVISYQQLDEAANRLAHHLISSGLEPRQRVCLVVQRSIDMLIGIFAILKAGCQYVPIDGGVTSEQALKHIFTDINARFIVCLPQFWDKIRRFARRDARIFALGGDVSVSYPSTRPLVRITPQDGAYVIYTSGMLLVSSLIYHTNTFCRKYGKAQRCRCLTQERYQYSTTRASTAWGYRRIQSCTNT